MPISDAQFANWCKIDNANRVILVQLDYMYESSGAPVLGTICLGTKFYTDNGSPPLRYRECLDAKSPLLFSRSLTGPTLGNYTSSLGSIEINNENGEYDFLLRLAIDNSEVRVYLGALDWVFSDFRQLFSAISVRADAPSTKRISIPLKDASALLNKSVGGEILVGGTASSAQKYRPANLGLTFQVPCEVLDPVELQYVHSDRGAEGGTAIQMYDRGIEVTFTDNSDGTSNLAFPPDGQVTADVLAVSPASPVDPTNRKVSDIMFMLVGDRCGMDLAGRYAGAGPTFTVGDEDDYPMGLSIPSAQNVTRTILPDIAQSGNCFWTILRLGSFSFGRLQPQDISGLGLTPVKIRKGDIDSETLKAVKVADPTYYRLQCLINKNWYVASDVAAAVDPDRQNLLRSEGLVLQQDEAVGTTYADAPELYDLSLAVSPVLPTLISVDVADIPDPATVAAAWMERQRFMYLPWLDAVAFRCGIQFYELELGDVVELTVDRFGCDAGELFQVIGINLLPVSAKIELTLLRRLTAEPIPSDWTRVLEDTDLSFQGATITRPPVEPPVGPPLPPGVPSVTSVSFMSLTPSNPITTFSTYQRIGHFEGQIQNFGRWGRSVAINSAGDIAVVGKPNTLSDQGSSVTGWLDVYTRSGDTWSLLTTLDNSADPNTVLLGASVGIADDGTIVAAEWVGARVHVFTPAGGGTYTHTLIRNSGGTLAGSNVSINRNGDIIVVVESYGDVFAYVYKLVSGTWSLQDTIGSISPDTIETCTVVDDGHMIILSCVDVSYNLNLRVYRSNPGRTAWSLTSNMTPTSDNGNTRNFDAQDVWISSDGAIFAAVAPNDQDTGSWPSSPAGDGRPTVFIYKNNGADSFARQSWSRTSTGARYLGGPVALSDDASVLFFGETEFGPGVGGASPGRVFYVRRPDLLSGTPNVMDTDHWHVLPNPYRGVTDRQHFGAAIASSADGTYIVVASANFDAAASRSTVDFFKYATLLTAGTVLYQDTMDGSAGTFSGRSPNVGGAYTAEDGSLADQLISGSGYTPSRDKTGGAFGVDPASTLDHVVDDGGYKIRADFEILSLGGGTSSGTLDFVARIESGDLWIVEAYLNWFGGVFHLYPYVSNVDGGTVYSDGIDVTSALGVGTHYLEVEVTTSGTVWKIDGSTVASDSGVSDGYPDGVVFENSKTDDGGNVTSINVSELKITALGIEPII